MRFAYIDSQGKEVGIPSVEALQLRIELGAITDETVFYDESADRWAPASEHEVFRSLSRELKARTAEGPRPTPPNLWAQAPGDREPGDGSSPGRAPDPFSMEQDPLDPEPEQTTEEAFSVEGGEVEPIAETHLDADVMGAEPAECDVAPDASSSPEGDLLAIELGDSDTLELASGFSERSLETASASGGVEDEGEDAAPDVSAGLELETPLSDQEFGDGGAPDLSESLGQGASTGGADESVRDMAEGLVLDDPAVPAAERDTPHPFDDEPGPEVEETEEKAPAPRTAPGRTDPYDRRPRPPQEARPKVVRTKRRRGQSRGKGAAPFAIGAVAIVAVLWGGWSLFGPSGETVEEPPSVELPPLAAALEVPMRAAADAAWLATLDSFRALAEEVGLPEAPNEDWLAGVYLANAESYDGIAGYWGAVQRYLDRVRASGESAYVAALGAAIDSAGLAGLDRDAVHARALAGYQANAPQREQVLGNLQELIDASTDLHDFLVLNQHRIQYAPAAGISRDPVTEAIPDSPELREEMWNRVERITSALDALGTLDRVTSERIVQVFTVRLERVGIR